MIDQYINHVVLVLDASSSMGGIEKEVVTVADNTIAYLAQRSQELDQETRITVYSFSMSNKFGVFERSDRYPSQWFLTGGEAWTLDGAMLILSDLLQGKYFRELRYPLKVCEFNMDTGFVRSVAVVNDVPTT